MNLSNQNTKPVCIISQIEKFLNNKNLSYQVNENSDERSVIHLGFNLESGNINTFFVIHHPINVVEIISFIPFNVPKNKRSEVSKFLSMMETTYYIGGFQLNHKDGQVRTKTYFLFGEEEINQGIIEANMNIGSTFMINDTLPGIMKICYGNKDAGSVFAEISNNLDVRMN